MQLRPHLEPLVVAHLSTLRATCKLLLNWFERQSVRQHTDRLVIVSANVDVFEQLDGHVAYSLPATLQGLAPRKGLGLAALLLER